MRDIYPTRTVSLGLNHRVLPLANTKNTLKSEDRPVEQVNKVKICSIAKTKWGTTAHSQRRIVTNNIKQWNMKGKKFPFHFILYPSGKISSCLNLHSYVENSHFDANTIGIAHLRSDESQPGVWSLRSIKKLYNYFKEENLKWIWPNGGWESKVEGFKSKYTDFFDDSWEAHFSEKKGDISMQDLKEFLRGMFTKLNADIKSLSSSVAKGDIGGHSYLFKRRREINKNTKKNG